ncbi:hypothetical protein T4A_7315 [Trichinella pseudospiralis]|uniref:Uncharacterized protein n=1 Tax=Trichinella pseudospiralis TaxID=6337 RepID=A0A0V1DUX1_TRIPS|nr:hypothetical protein T4A_7315 [Trichinella pseudospiralis]
MGKKFSRSPASLRNRSNNRSSGPSNCQVSEMSRRFNALEIVHHPRSISALYTGITQVPSSRELLGSSKKYTVVFVYAISLLWIFLVDNDNQVPVDCIINPQFDYLNH